MVHATTMTLVMAEKDPPVFRDFLGIGRKDESSSKHPQASSGFLKRGNTCQEEEGEAETSARASSGNSGRCETLSAPVHMTPPIGTGFPSSSEPGSEGWLRARGGVLQHHGVKSAFYKPENDNRPVKRRESPAGRESLQERLQMSVEALENSRPLKVARVEQKDDKKVKFRNATSNMDELRLSMQPPRPSKGAGTLQTNASKAELASRVTNKPERLRGSAINVGMSTPARLSHLSMLSENPSAQLTIENSLARENMGLPPMPTPAAADEGSRTGIKGSGLLAGLQQSTPAQAPVMTSGPSPSPRRTKVSSHSAGSDSVLPSRHQFQTPQSRQLTIFYGGQAHVFDDVPPDKATQIMQLAGSNGRSWSTTYSQRQTTAANSASEGSLSAMEREREKPPNSSKGASVSGGGKLALSPDVQTLLRGLAQSGTGRSAQGPPPSDVPPLSAEMQLSASERAVANEIRKDMSERRALTRPAQCTEDSAKEALLRGQHWM